MGTSSDNLIRLDDEGRGEAPLSVEECRALLREGGVREQDMSDEEVIDVRDTLAALAGIAVAEVMRRRE